MDKDALKEALENCEDGYEQIKWQSKKERKELIDKFIEYLHIIAKREMTIYEVIKKFEKM